MHDKVKLSISWFCNTCKETQAVVQSLMVGMLKTGFGIHLDRDGINKKICPPTALMQVCTCSLRVRHSVPCVLRHLCTCSVRGGHSTSTVLGVCTAGQCP